MTLQNHERHGKEPVPLVDVRQNIIFLSLLKFSCEYYIQFLPFSANESPKSLLGLQYYWTYMSDVHFQNLRKKTPLVNP